MRKQTDGTRVRRSDFILEGAADLVALAMADGRAEFQGPRRTAQKRIAPLWIAAWRSESSGT